ncbi:MAG: hypothetical protein SGILL_003907, partial [Bacillariaceae sp.]
PQQQQQQEKSESKRRGAKKAPPGGAPVYAPQLNPSYVVASAVVRHNVEKLSAPISTLLNGLVNSDSRSIGESTLTTQLEEYRDSDSSDHLSSPDYHDDNDRHRRKPNSSKPKTTPAEQAILDLAKAIGQPQPQQQDSHVTSHVWNIIFELQVVEPSTLTTIIGTLASSVDTTDFGQRVMVTQTLGKLFLGHQRKGQKDSNLALAVEYVPCFRAWLLRSADKRLEIRQLMLPHLIEMSKACCTNPNTTTGPKGDLVREVHAALLKRLSTDPSTDFRKKVIQDLCNVAYQHRRILPLDLMSAIGTQVLSKIKDERRDALTGLVQTYYRQYIKYNLNSVLEGGDDCPIEAVLGVLKKCCQSSSSATSKDRLSLLMSPKGKENGRKRRNWRRHDESDEDDDDRDMGDDDCVRNQDDFDYFQWIPSVLFESASYTDSVDPDMRSRVVMLVDELLLGKHLTSTARATGLALVVDGVRNQSDLALHWMGVLLDERAKLQTTLKAYLDARADIRNHVAGSEGYLAADSKAMDLLEKVARMTAPPSGSFPPVPGERNDVLEKFHTIKDKHVFRILGTITHPTHSINARLRATNDLPKRVQATAGDSVRTWVVSLVQRCAMGDFLNQDVVHHCVILAHECFQQEDWKATKQFLTCIEMAARRFPKLCASEEDFGTLTEIFSESSSISSSSAKKKKQIDKANILTTLSSILAMASPSRALGAEPSKCEEDIHKQLIKLCRDGTPEQARHATATMVALLKPKEGLVLTQEENDSFLPLLQTLATPSQLSIAAEGSSTKTVCVLVALTELAENAPKIFENETRGQKTVKFALESVLLGRAHSASGRDPRDDSSGSDDSDAEDENEAPKRKTPKGRRTTKSKKSTGAVDHLSPSGKNTSPVDNNNLSICCRTLCAAIEFLVTYIRSNVLTNKNAGGDLSKSTQDSIEKFFDVLSTIIRDQGMPPSTRDRKLFSFRQDRAALRQCAAISLLRLCDSRLDLDQKHLSTERWHRLAGMLLDDEKVVRSNVMEELGRMLTCHGKYATDMGRGAMAPRLRFLAFVVLCTDGDHNADHSTANGNAANVGKHINNAKGNTEGSIKFSRHAYEMGALMARARGEKAEKTFQTIIKPTAMPEYAVPYAFHILAFRRETPRARSGKKGDKDDDYEIDDSGQRVLQKRVKTLLEILTKTADGNNVSFLLRMAEIISKMYPKSPSSGTADGEEHQGKLLNVCQVSREVLLSLVKRDENLESFPGAILVPRFLFGNRPRKNRVIALEAGPGFDILRVDNAGNNDEDEAMHDDSEDGPSQPSNDSAGGEDDLLSSSENDDATRASRRSTRSANTRKSSVGDDNKSPSSFPGQDDETLSTRRRSTKSGSKRKSYTSSASSKTDSVSPGQSKRSRTTLDDSMISDRTTPSRSVHFSPDKPMEFDGLSPIAKNPSPTANGLSSDETKTRGMTPATGEPDLTSTSRSPTPVSGDSASKREEAVEKRESLPGRRRTRKLPTPKADKENAPGGKKQKKKVPQAIKVVRKPSPKLAASKNANQKKTRGSTRKRKPAFDPFEFDG